MKGFQNAMVITLATLASMATIPSNSLGFWAQDQLVEQDEQIVKTDQRDADTGRVLKSWELPVTADYSSPINILNDNEKRKSLRRAYDGRLDRRTSDPYHLLSAAGSHKASELGQEEVDFTPQIIKDDGNENANYVVVISAKWCPSCVAMYPMLERLKKEGYIVYIFDTTVEEYKDYDALYNCRLYPTIMIYNNAKETNRTFGKTEGDWIRKRLKTKKEQNLETNPYDGL